MLFHMFKKPDAFAVQTCTLSVRATGLWPERMSGSLQICELIHNYLKNTHLIYREVLIFACRAPQAKVSGKIPSLILRAMTLISACVIWPIATLGYSGFSLNPGRM